MAPRYKKGEKPPDDDAGQDGGQGDMAERLPGAGPKAAGGGGQAAFLGDRQKRLNKGPVKGCERLFHSLMNT